MSLNVSKKICYNYNNKKATKKKILPPFEIRYAQPF